jgi:hypothetical protein
MNAREALIAAVEALEQMGFVILPRSEVEAIRNKALEEAAEKARELLVFAGTTSDADEHIPAAIRKLKSGGSQPR